MSGRGRGQALKEAIAKVRLNDPSSVCATTIDDRVKKEGTLCVPIFEPQEWHGAKGSPERLVANYIKLEKCDRTEDTSQGGIHEYHLEFCPKIDNLQERFRCLYQHKDAIGQFHVFDGKTLHLPFKITMVIYLKGRQLSYDNITISFRKVFLLQSKILSLSPPLPSN